MLRLLGLSLLATAALAGLAHAGPYDGMVRKDVTVYYRDLDLASEAGARVLLARITTAAKEACGDYRDYAYYDIAPAAARREFATCQSNAVQNAVRAIHSPTLANVYAMNDKTQALRLAAQ